jgi:hypothetical protein
MDANGVREMLKIKLDRRYGGCVKKAAWDLKMAEEHLRKQINGVMPPGRNILKWLGLKRVFHYEYIGLPELAKAIQATWWSSRMM